MFLSLPVIHLASQSPFTVHGDIVKRSTMPQNLTRCDDSFKKLPINNYILLIYRWRGLSPSVEDAHQTCIKHIRILHDHPRFESGCKMIRGTWNVVRRLT